MPEEQPVISTGLRDLTIGVAAYGLYVSLGWRQKTPSFSRLIGRCAPVTFQAPGEVRVEEVPEPD